MAYSNTTVQGTVQLNHFKRKCIIFGIQWKL